MKKLIALVAAVVFTTSTVGLVLAQQAPPATEKKADDKMGEKKAPAKKMSAKTANGTVKSASADSLVVTGKAKGKDAEWTFGVDGKTKIKKAGKDVMAADLKAGDAVTVRYMEHEGKQVAQSVTVKPGKVAKDASNPCAGKKPAASQKPADKKM